MNREVKVLIVDDHEIVRQGFKLILNAQDDIDVTVSELPDGESVVELYDDENFDVVFMDINMSHVGGIEATKNLLKKHESAKVIAFSMHNDDYNIKEMIEAGAYGYLLKDTNVEEIKRAIKIVLGGKKYFSNEVALKLLGLQEQSTPIAKITKRELQVLKQIANGHTNDEIANVLNISKRTVDCHRQNLLTKFNCKNTVGLITYAAKNNLISI